MHLPEEHKSRSPNPRRLIIGHQPNKQQRPRRISSDQRRLWPHHRLLPCLQSAVFRTTRLPLKPTRSSFCNFEMLARDSPPQTVFRSPSAVANDATLKEMAQARPFPVAALNAVHGRHDLKEMGEVWGGVAEGGPPVLRPRRDHVPKCADTKADSRLHANGHCASTTILYSSPEGRPSSSSSQQNSSQDPALSPRTRVFRSKLVALIRRVGRHKPRDVAETCGRDCGSTPAKHAGVVAGFWRSRLSTHVRQHRYMFMCCSHSAAFSARRFSSKDSRSYKPILKGADGIGDACIASSPLYARLLHRVGQIDKTCPEPRDGRVLSSHSNQAEWRHSLRPVIVAIKLWRLICADPALEVLRTASHRTTCHLLPCTGL